MKHPLGPVLAALKVRETLMRSRSTTLGSKQNNHRVSVNTHPLPHGGHPVISEIIGQGVEEGPGQLLTNVALDERSNCLIRSQVEQGY